MNEAPYRATIEIDLWVWDRARAFNVLAQLVTAFEAIPTIDGDGGGTHHRITATEMIQGGKCRV